nr:putative ribosome-binding factor A, mitochondrial [Lytechinus pictus]
MAVICYVRQILTSRLIYYGAENLQNTLICRLSTSTCYNKNKITHGFSLRKFEKMMTKKKKKFYSDPVHTSQLGKMTVLNPISKKPENKHGQKEGVRLQVFNTILYEHIVDLVNSNYISEELEQLQVQILSVRVAGDMSVARVYWQASGNAESDDKVQGILDKYTGRVRHTLISLHVLGNVPRVCFLKDKTAANIAEVNHLLASADFGPIDNDSPTEGALHRIEWHGSYDADRQDGFTREWKHGKGAEDRFKGPNFFTVDHADALAQIASQKKQESPKVPDGFSPITNSIEKFKVFQKKKKIKRKMEEYDIDSIDQEEDFEVEDPREAEDI